jgi:hypothetical protein
MPCRTHDRPCAAEGAHSQHPHDRLAVHFLIATLAEHVDRPLFDDRSMVNYGFEQIKNEILFSLSFFLPVLPVKTGPCSQEGRAGETRRGAR